MTVNLVRVASQKKGSLSTDHKSMNTDTLGLLEDERTGSQVSLCLFSCLFVCLFIKVKVIFTVIILQYLQKYNTQNQHFN